MPADSGYATNVPTKVPPWHGLVAWDILLNNLSTGLFLVAALCELAEPEEFHSVAKVAYPIALVLLFADLTCLTLDLGDPLRFHHMLRVFKPSSPMSLGTWSLTLFSMLLTVIVVLSTLPVRLDWIHVLAVSCGLPLALASAVYKGVLFSTSAQPVWKDARWLGGYLTNSALMLGSAEMLGLSLLMQEEQATQILRVALGVLLGLNLICLGLLLANIRDSISQSVIFGRLGRMIALAVGGGGVVPLVLLGIGGDILLTIAVVLVLLRSLVFRFVIVWLPQSEGRPAGFSVAASNDPDTIRLR